MSRNSWLCFEINIEVVLNYKYSEIVFSIVNMKSYDFLEFMSIFLPERILDFELETLSRPSLALRRDISLAAARSLLLEKGHISLSQLSDVCISHEPSGQPFLRMIGNGAGSVLPPLSVSHSCFWVGCLIGESLAQVGLDIEDMKSEGRLSPRPLADLAKYAFSPSEIEFVNLYQEKGFYRIWTTKEAIAKCTGQGLDTALSLDLGEQFLSFFSSGDDLNDGEISLELKVHFFSGVEDNFDMYTIRQIIMDKRLMVTIAQRKW